VKFLIFYAAVMGLSWCITILAIGSPLRWLVDLTAKASSGSSSAAADDAKPLTKIQILFRCPACIGFWIAGLLSWFVYSPCLDSGLTRVIILASVLDGLVAVALNWVTHVVLTRLGQYEL
jgi:hypothetical protein